MPLFCRETCHNDVIPTKTSENGIIQGKPPYNDIYIANNIIIPLVNPR